ncbi:sensor histidine kinase [Hamadaea sp. NPDC050747]|uniref:sensor histidine kinase n=1 Tax=Hamadaea sp. NPDC050747 TaxID=3155789 RepID=UPI0033DC7C6A
MRGTWVDRLATGGVGVASVMIVYCGLVAVSQPVTFWSIVMPLSVVAYVSVPLVGAAMARADRRNLVGWLLLASGIALPGACAAYLVAEAEFAATGTVGWAGWWDGWPWVIALGLPPVIGLLLFPDGRLPSRRWRPVLAVAILQAIALTFGLTFAPGLLDYPQLANPAALSGGAGQIADASVGTILLIPPLSTLAAWTVHRRRRRAADPAQAAALRMVAPAAWTVAASWWGCVVVTAAGATDIAALPAQMLGVLALAITAWVAIRRYGMFDGRRVVHSALLYGLLTGLVTGFYLLVAALMRALAPGGVGSAAAIAAALLVALPLRDFLQRVVNRLVYGYRDDPYQALVRLGEALEVAASGDLLADVTASIRSALRLSFVEVRVNGATMASDGRPGGGVRETFPLVFAGETIGDLIAESDEAFTTAERRLIGGLLGQVAAAGHAVRLERDLQRSRERIVGAAEEERRRLRRDLHDGLGPALAGVVLGLHRVRGRLAGDAVAAEQLDTLTQQTQAAVADVRRLVYGLRPPALDELGLVGALTEQASTLGSIEVCGPADELQLSAAVEVAAYRIALEAMTNTVRHAQAAHTVVHLATVDHSLQIEIADDGVGLPDAYRAGVGITSMRERATELGGSCHISPREPRGTLVRATLPLEPR